VVVTATLAIVLPGWLAWEVGSSFERSAAVAARSTRAALSVIPAHARNFEHWND
jgi:hypothetical protein